MSASEILARMFGIEDKIRRVLFLMARGAVSLDKGREELRKLREELHRCHRKYQELKLL